jgi:Homeodomain-like domain
MTKGQQAMAVARICSETEQTVRRAAAGANISTGRVGQALTVLRFAPSLVDLVIREQMGLDAAYKQALATKTAREARKKGASSIAFQLSARGLTQEQIAEQFGVGQSTIHNWLIKFAPNAELINDADPLPDKASLDRIARSGRWRRRGSRRCEMGSALIWLKVCQLAQL